jgi:hypothetical protein
MRAAGGPNQLCRNRRAWFGLRNCRDSAIDALRLMKASLSFRRKAGIQATAAPWGSLDARLREHDTAVSGAFDLSERIHYS